MSSKLKLSLVAGFILAGAAGLAGSASAASAQGWAPAIATSQDLAVKAENVRLVCPPYRPCFWAPGWRYGPYRAYTPYGLYRPYYRPYYRPFGWHRW